MECWHTTNGLIADDFEAVHNCLFVKGDRSEF